MPLEKARRVVRTARRRRSAQPVGIDDAVAAVTEVLSGREVGPRSAAPDDRFEDLGLDSLDITECVIVLELAIGVELDLTGIETMETVGDLTGARRRRGGVGPASE